MNKLEDTINVRECCEGVSRLTPASLANRPGLSALAYRVGTHASFKTTMLAQLSTVSALRALTTRRDDDPTIALLDAWATVADVLTFYQERVANEGFLRTATERRSLLEMARLIGYELRPGVTASTYLAFTIEDTPGAPKKVIIPAGTRAQSVPGKEQLPQTFETSEEIIGRPEWNALRPRTKYPQYFDKNTRRFYFRGTETNLKPGDWMLLLARESSDPDDTGDIHKVPLQVVRVETNHDKQHTKVDLDTSQEVPLPFTFEYPIGQFSLEQQVFTGANIAGVVTQSMWHASDLFAYAAIQRWPKSSLGHHVNKATKVPEPPVNVGVFALRLKAAPFGHNAQKWLSTPEDWRKKGGAYPLSWEDRNITTDSQGTTTHPEGVIYLESTFREIREDSWVVIKSTDEEARVYRVEANSGESLADYGLSAKVTRLILDRPDYLEKYTVRETTIYAQSEKLELAELPFEENIEGDTFELDSMQVDLAAGKTLILTGDRADLEGVIDSEVVILADVVHAGGYTQLTFTHSLQRPYRRETVTLNANVARATHGETKQEVLGSGDASQAMQRLTLRQKPLTYVSAPVSSGGVSTLEVRVNAVLWQEAPDLYRLGPEDRAYIIRHDDEGKTIVQFGDGVHGVRVPSGSENVTAKYRIGIGLGGMVDADQATLLQTRPLGVRGVTNPLAPTGAEDPETRDQARENAPLTVLTLDRIVSLKDFEDFARAFSGIGKASAIWVWDGESRIIHVTIAAANGDPVSSDSDLYRNLLEAMNHVRDPFQRLRIESFQTLLFNLDAAVHVHPDYEDERVLTEVEATLRVAFSFTARTFGQSVALSEVMALIQHVEGVEAVDVNYFYYSHEIETPSIEPLLPAAPATLKPDGTIQPAQLLTITPAPIGLSVMG